ncbi:divergent polysaccharide deacetylase family protein [Methylocystis echinoides]|uniref:divergent polysaccharide deacetylase family protein n=1 Tax=Methylocystis echinoides TaxID=29468 RepID=UPI003438F984
MTDELNAPLGGKPRPPRRARALRGSPLTLAAGALMAGGVAALYLAPVDPGGGQPYALARIEPAPDPPSRAPPPAAVRPSETPQGDNAAADMEFVSGVKVTRRGEAGSARIIRVEPASGARLAPAPDRRVTEKGRYGLLPKTGDDGARPMDVYARPFVARAALKAGAPRLAIVVGGVGLNPQSSQAAIEELPEDVTLAFAPYGAELNRLVAQARGRGHEALLQAPMEPFDYPRNNPGPHTLVTGAGDGGADDLDWLMSRFAGYAGVMNYLGGRFTADETAMSVALGEIARRGLFYLDDGLSPQSQAAGIAKKLAAPYAKVDIVVDARGAPQAMDAALARLEAVAREKGVAIGFANASSAAIARIAPFARDLERRGVALVPVSAALAPRSAAAAASDTR